MRALPRPVGLAVCASILFASAAAAEVPRLVLTPVTGGFDRITTLSPAGDGSGRLFVVERPGTVRIVLADGTALSQPFLDISDRVDASSIELGLLAMAFDPQYPANRRFFVAYTDLAGDAVVSSFLATPGDPHRADPRSESEVLRLPQPSPIHNIHHLAFGPDGFLYIGSGDGGPANDPADKGQNLSVLLGKILRLDVSGPIGYTVPPDNPFVGQPDARAEIWSYGLRNPANFSFDRLTGDLLVADVGQQVWEELDFQPAASRGGENYGWSLMEGNHCFDPPTNCSVPGLTAPVLEYPHVADGDCAIIGGYRYRGAAQRPLRGYYVFSDFCSGAVRLARPGCGGWWMEVATVAPGRVAALGEDEAGELYLGGWSGEAQGILYHLEAPGDEVFADGFESGDASRWSQCIGG
jgi:glucose/arabinose dehydrogenase